jgi:hypothetical protein
MGKKLGTKGKEGKGIHTRDEKRREKKRRGERQKRD